MIEKTIKTTKIIQKHDIDKFMLAKLIFTPHHTTLNHHNNIHESFISGCTARDHQQSHSTIGVKTKDIDSRSSSSGRSTCHNIHWL
jgi:hypothetical protein